MSVILKKTSKDRTGFTSSTRLITKSFDLGDPALMKSFSQCNVSYKTDGTGISPIVVVYKIDNNATWKSFKSDATNAYSAKGNKLVRTNNIVKTASFKFAKRSVGRKVKVKLYYNATGASSTTVNDFELIDISFTYRPLNRN